MTTLLTFYLSRVVNRKIFFPELKQSGILKDILVDISHSRPKAIAVLIKVKDKLMYFNINDIEIVKSNRQYNLSCHSVKDIKLTHEANLILLVANILNKQIIDINGRKLVRANDVRLVYIPAGIFVIAVGVVIDGFLWKLGIEKIYKKTIRFFKPDLPGTFVLWDDVETVDTEKEGIKLSKTYTKLKDLHPSDLADIIEDLDKLSQTKLFTSLDEEHAADVLEQMEVAAQVHIIETLPVEKAADVLEKMPADEVADILDELKTHKAEELLKNMGGELSEEIRDLLEYPDNSVGSIMSTDVITFKETLLASEAINHLRSLKPENESTYLFFITDNRNKLLATITLRELILAHPLAQLSDIMNKKMIAVFDTDGLGTLAEIISKYKVLAIPVTNQKKQLEGMVVIDDIVEDLLKAGKTK